MWTDGLKDLARGIAQLVFPNSCLICDHPEEEDNTFRHGLCNSCLDMVVADSKSACERCAATIGPFTETDKGCVACRDLSFGFVRAIRLGPYESRLREAVIRMKLPEGEALSEMMGKVFWEARCEQLRSAGTEVVVPVPLHWRRTWFRCHNQAAAVASEIAKGLKVPSDNQCLRRIRHTPQQLQPSAAARRENVRGAFRVSRRSRLAGKRILLVDDVMTTGSTASEAARSLREGGAASVVVAILARR
jgi:ComF family protein